MELSRLIERCEGSVSIDCNPHRDCYQTIEQYLKEYSSINNEDFNYFIKEEIGIQLYEEILNHNILIKIQFYPLTPIGFYVVYHYDLDLAVKECHEILDKKKSQ